MSEPIRFAYKLVDVAHDADANVTHIYLHAISHPEPLFLLTCGPSMSDAERAWFKERVGKAIAFRAEDMAESAGNIKDFTEQDA